MGRSTDDSDGWAHEIEDRHGRIDEVAAELHDPTPANIEEVFHADDSLERIRLRAIDGPRGPIYLAEDGTHRISGAMMAGLESIPAQVERSSYPLELMTADGGEAAHWERLLSAGMITGSIKEGSAPDGAPIKHLRIESEVAPWVRTKNQWELAKISQAYEQLYPNSLDDLTVPRDALTDSVAFEFYLSGRWDEWVAK